MRRILFGNQRALYESIDFCPNEYAIEFWKLRRINVEATRDLEVEVCRAANASLGLTLRANQLHVGTSLVTPCIAELATGEGKTLAAVLPLAYWARYKRGVLLSTANDYLASRDAAWMREVFDRLGLSVGCVQDGQSPAERRKAYACDVTYGTIREFGFDFLRDTLQTRNHDGFSASLHPQQPVQRSPFALIVDEADSLLIDEARTPLVISSQSKPMRAALEACYYWCSRNAASFLEHTDYARLPIAGEIAFTEAGKSKLFELVMPPTMNSLTLIEIVHAMERAIFVNYAYHRDKHYLVRDNSVCIIDEYTGRVSEGRKWGDGIHQAIEARESLPLTPSTYAAAQITVQDFVRRFEHLSGLTGTAWEARHEFRQVYGLQVKRFASNVPSQRRILPSIVCRTRNERSKAVVEESQKMLEQGRAVLIGTRSVVASQELASFFEDLGIECSLLNATNPQCEAKIIARAGIRGTVTVATNMAGRGTDIAISDAVRAAGGLHVIGTELHAAERIDRQLAGRCGRQGDPGSFRQYLSLDDELLATAWGPSEASLLRRRWAISPNLADAVQLFRKAQRVISDRQRADREALSHRGESLQELYRRLGLHAILDQCHHEIG